MYSSCSKKAPFVVHKITIDYAFDQVFRAKMQSLHENFAPQILVFRHELPFFPSYFVWNPFFSLFISFLLCLLSSVTSVSHFLFSPLFLLLSPTNPKNVGDFLEKVHCFLEKVHCFLEKVHRFFENLHRFLEATL